MSQSLEKILEQLIAESRKIENEITDFQDRQNRLVNLRKCVDAKLENLISKKFQLKIQLQNIAKSNHAGQQDAQTLDQAKSQAKLLAEIQKLENEVHQTESSILNVTTADSVPDENCNQERFEQTPIDSEIVQEQIQIILGLVNRLQSTQLTVTANNVENGLDPEIGHSDRQSFGGVDPLPERESLEYFRNTPSDIQAFQLVMDKTSLEKQLLQYAKNAASMPSLDSKIAVVKKPSANLTSSYAKRMPTWVSSSRKYFKPRLPLPSLRSLLNGTAPLPRKLPRSSFYNFENLDTQVDNNISPYASQFRVIKQKFTPPPSPSERLQQALYSSAPSGTSVGGTRRTKLKTSSQEVKPPARNTISEILTRFSNDKKKSDLNQSQMQSESPKRSISLNRAKPTIRKSFPAPATLPKASADKIESNRTQFTPSRTNAARSSSNPAQVTYPQRSTVLACKNPAARKSHSESAGRSWNDRKRPTELKAGIKSGGIKHKPHSSELCLKYGNFPKIIETKRAAKRSVVEQIQMYEKQISRCPKPSNIPSTSWAWDEDETNDLPSMTNEEASVDPEIEVRMKTQNFEPSDSSHAIVFETPEITDFTNGNNPQTPVTKFLEAHIRSTSQ